MADTPLSGGTEQNVAAILDKLGITGSDGGAAPSADQLMTGTAPTIAVLDSSADAATITTKVNDLLAALKNRGVLG